MNGIERPDFHSYSSSPSFLQLINWLPVESTHLLIPIRPGNRVRVGFANSSFNGSFSSHSE